MIRHKTKKAFQVFTNVLIDMDYVPMTFNFEGRFIDEINSTKLFSLHSLMDDHFFT